MSQWHRLAGVEECPEGTGIERVAGDRVVALFRVGGEFYALDGVCPHQGGPLGKGSLTGCIVTCPWHGWQFDVRTGRSQLSAKLVHPRFEVQTRDDSVWVRIEAET